MRENINTFFEEKLKFILKTVKYAALFGEF